MNNKNLSNIDYENEFLHFTNSLNMETIDKYGLLPAIGENSNGPESNKKVFFAKGIDGALKICDVWVKWTINKMNGYSQLSKEYSGDELRKKTAEWNKKFVSKEYLNDELKKEKAFENIYKDMRNRQYIALDLKENEDYKENDIDEAKSRILNRVKGNYNNIGYKQLSEMYGKYSNINSPIMDKWNMHTLVGKTITPDKITEITTDDGKKDAMSLIIDMYEKEKNINKDNEFDILDEFVSYAKEKIKEEELNKDINNNKDEKEDNSVNKEKDELLKKNGLDSLIIKLGKETLDEQKDTKSKDTVEDVMERQQREISQEKINNNKEIDER